MHILTSQLVDDIVVKRQEPTVSYVIHVTIDGNIESNIITATANQTVDEVENDRFVVRRTSIQRQRFVSVRQQWDYDHPCSHCGCIYLVSNTKDQRKFCCQEGTLLNLQVYNKLHPLSNRLLDTIVTHLPHFTRQCTSYNSILAFGALCIDNGKDIGIER